MSSRPSVRVFALLLPLTLTAISPLSAADAAAAAAFDRIKALEGTWVTPPEPTGEVSRHEFRLTAGGSLVMETMGSGTAHEMINMYHLDGDDLVLTHYCAAGNQPTMRLAKAAADSTELVFEFTGGTNLDPAVDPHIHEGRLAFLEGGGLQSTWVSYDQGVPQPDVMVFELTRQP